MLYNSKAYEAAGEGYEELVPLMGHKPELLFEAAQCLSKSERFEEANRLLERAMKLSGDPMIHYMTAKNEQSMGNYQKAEIYCCTRSICYRNGSIRITCLPNFTRNLLSFQEDKFIKAADAVLKKEPKVESTAIREMREEVKILIQNRK